MKGFFEPHVDLAAKVLDLRLERQNLVAGNLANLNSPGYKPRRLEFEEQLQDALALDKRGKITRTSEKHMPSTFSANGFKGDHIKDFEPRQVFGEDQVDLDKEIGVMAKNAMMYNALTQILTKDFTNMQKVIMDGAK